MCACKTHFHVVSGAWGDRGECASTAPARATSACVARNVDAARGHVVSVDRLVEAIWEDDGEPQRGEAAYADRCAPAETALSAPGGDPAMIASDDAGYRLVAVAAPDQRVGVRGADRRRCGVFSRGASDLAADALERAVGLFLARLRGICALFVGACRSDPLERAEHDAIELLATALLDRGAAERSIPRLEAAIADYPYRRGCDQRR